MILPRIGEFKERIDIVNVTSPYDIDGVGTISSTLISGLWAKIEPLGGEKYNATQQVQACSQQYRVWIRYRDGVTPFQQIVWGGKRLIMTGPPEDFDRHWLLLHAQNVTSRKL